MLGKRGLRKLLELYQKFLFVISLQKLRDLGSGRFYPSLKQFQYDLAEEHFQVLKQKKILNFFTVYLQQNLLSDIISWIPIFCLAV